MTTSNEIIERLEEAGATLLSLPASVRDDQNRNPASSIIRDSLEAWDWRDKGGLIPRPSDERIARMDEAMGWIGLIPLDRYVLRRIVGARSLVHPVTDRHLFPWRRLGATMGADHKAVQRWHAQAIEMIAAALDAGGVP